MKILQIGAGNFGERHLHNWKELGVELYVADTNENRFEVCVAECGLDRSRFTTDYRKFLPLVDAIDIATPSSTHFQIARECLESGKDVFVEKPMANNSSESRKLVELAESLNKILMVGHVFVYNPVTQHVKTLIDKSELGEIYFVRAQFNDFKDLRADSGALFNLANIMSQFSIICLENHLVSLV